MTNHSNCVAHIDVGSSLTSEYSLLSYTVPSEPDICQIGVKNLGGDFYALYSQISDNGQGLFNTDDSWADLGYDEWSEETGFNNIVCNLIDINTFEDIVACCNYWGGDEPDNFDGDGEVEYDPWLEECDDQNPFDGECGGLYKSSGSGLAKSAESVSKFLSEDYKLYKQGHSKYKKEDFSAAISDFENLISKYPESFFARFALQKWLLIKFKLNSKNEILPYLSSLKESKSVDLSDYANQMEVLAYRKLNQYNTALSLTTASKNKSKSDLYNSFFKYQEALIYKNDLKDSKCAEISFNEYEQEYPEDGRIPLINQHLNSISASNQSLSKKDIFNNSDLDSYIPLEFELIGNYPNPFNPETNIQFTLAEQANVTIHIYNILGQKIWNNTQVALSSGKHDILWNGQNEFGENVSSGFYIIHFVAESDKIRFEDSSRMLLIR